MKESITLSRNIVNELLQLAQASPDKEICGLIGKNRSGTQRCYPVENTHSNPETRFNMDGACQIKAMKDMRENGEELFAIYHSHPTAAAVPSQTDLAEAAYPETLYLIISLNTKGVLEMRGYYLRDKVEEVSIGI